MIYIYIFSIRQEFLLALIDEALEQLLVEDEVIEEIVEEKNGFVLLASNSKLGSLSESS